MPVDNKYHKYPRKTCCLCGYQRSTRQFYKSTLPAHNDGLIPICKSCVVEKSLNDSGDDIELRRFDTILQQCNRPLRKGVWRAAEREARYKVGHKTGRDFAESLLGFYFRQLNSLVQYQRMDYKNTDFWDDAPEDDEPEQEKPQCENEREGVYLNGAESYIVGLNYCDSTLSNYLCSMFNYLCKKLEISNDEQKKMLGDYVSYRVAQECGIAESDINYYRDNKSSADNILIALKAMRGTPEDEAFLDAISGYLDTEGADDD